MSTWKKIIANKNLIQAESERSVLDKIAGSELTFWHPKKCVRLDGKGGYRMTISYTDDFKFEAFRNGKGITNRSVKIEERTMSAADIEKAFAPKTQASSDDESQEA